MFILDWAEDDPVLSPMLYELTLDDPPIAVSDARRALDEFPLADALAAAADEANWVANNGRAEAFVVTLTESGLVEWKREAAKLGRFPYGGPVRLVGHTAGSDRDLYVTTTSRRTRRVVRVPHPALRRIYGNRRDPVEQ
jgi:hypothetical protein